MGQIEARPTHLKLKKILLTRMATRYERSREVQGVRKRVDRPPQSIALALHFTLVLLHHSAALGPTLTYGCLELTAVGLKQLQICINRFEHLLCGSATARNLLRQPVNPLLQLLGLEQGTRGY